MNAKKRRMIIVLVIALGFGIGLAALTLAASPGDGAVAELVTYEETWEFVADVEARSPSGEVLATRQVRAMACEDDGAGGCAVRWDWAGETFPAGTGEWYYPRFVGGEVGGPVETIAVSVVPEECGVDPRSCATDRRMSAEPPQECVDRLLQECGVVRDERGWFSNGGVAGGEARQGSWYVPLQGEWHEKCPAPPSTLTPWPTAPTLTPRPTCTPRPTPTCRPTWTPVPTDTPYPTATPYLTSTPWPEQPPW